ncbi:MAG: FecCD family ABC transporter permease [Beutenbergiaceae bacterium]
MAVTRQAPSVNHDPTAAPLGTHRRDRARLKLVALGVGLLAIITFSLPLGSYDIDIPTVARILLSPIFGWETGVTEAQATIVVQVRLPRIIGAVLVGGALAAAGAGYQSMFRNPLVSPAILGVSAGAGFGAASSILLGMPWPVVQMMAFIGGIAAALLALAISRTLGRGSTVVLVLAGIVVSTLFQAFISITQYLANPEDTLPTITFWLMGGLGRVRLDDLLLPTIIMVVSLVAMYLMRWQITVLAAGDDEAAALGVRRAVVWTVVITASTLMTASAVSMAGIIGWVGLIMPHLARFLIGPSFDRLLPAAVLMGAGFLLLVDDLARSASAMELPLGVLTALVGAPFFVFLLARARKQWL